MMKNCLSLGNVIEKNFFFAIPCCHDISSKDFVCMIKFLVEATATARDTGDETYLYRFKGYKNCIRKMKIRNVYCGVMVGKLSHTLTHT